MGLTLEELRKEINNIGIIEVLDKCGLLDGLCGNKILCPFHEEHTPSCHLYDTTRGDDCNRFHCFGCGADGDVFDFIKQLYSISFPQASLIIAESLGLELKLKMSNPFNRPVKTVDLENEWKHYLDCMDKMPDSVKKKAKEQFHSLEVGYDPKINYFVFRYTSKANKTLGFTKRRNFETEDKAHFPKWKHSDKQHSNIQQCASAFNLGNAIRSIISKKEVILVEGVKDIIPFMETEKLNAISISGTHNFKAVYRILPPIESFILALDPDEAGKKGMCDIAIMLVRTIPLDKIFYIPFVELDPFDYWEKFHSIPEKKTVLDLFDDAQLKTLYYYANDYNSEVIIDYLAKRKSLGYLAAKSFLSMGTRFDIKAKKEDELARLVQSNDKDALRKLQLKFGV